MEIHAILIGNDSLGYITNNGYGLKVKNEFDIIVIERLDGSGRCEYSTVLTFLSNWNNIKHLS